MEGGVLAFAATCIETNILVHHDRPHYINYQLQQASYVRCQCSRVLHFGYGYAHGDNQIKMLVLGRTCSSC